MNGDQEIPFHSSSANNSSTSNNRSSLDPPADQNQSGSKKIKKKVSFADDCGFELTTIRVLTKSSDVPPIVDYSIKMQKLKAKSLTVDRSISKPCSTWVVDFKQPAGDYLAFHRKLESTLVALENVFVKNDQRRLIGTVKVKDICYEKSVFVRFTDNEWKSYHDHPCTYLSTFDTFQFDFEIPCHDSIHHQRLEFCLCFRTDRGEEYWDNNQGRNYEVINEHLRMERNRKRASPNDRTVKNVMSTKCSNWNKVSGWKDFSVPNIEQYLLATELNDDKERFLLAF
jgi:protein phosphatase 1 regulatory subunit 3A/B/C/D/E